MIYTLYLVKRDRKVIVIKFQLHLTNIEQTLSLFLVHTLVLVPVLCAVCNKIMIILVQDLASEARRKIEIVVKFN